MFNTTIHRTTTEVTPVTRVIEKSVSPDKITDVYSEVRKEVENTILRTIYVESALLNGVIIEHQHVYDKANVILNMRFVLNGKEYISKREVPAQLTDEQLYKELADFYTNEITSVLMRDTARVLKKI